MPDAHIEQGDDLLRFRALANFIEVHRPSQIILGGDFLTLDSMSAWDLNSRAAMEGRRLKAELDKGLEAIQRIDNAIRNVQEFQRKSKKRIYNPVKVFLKGNHEDRLDRYLSTKPEIHGLIAVEEHLKLDKRGYLVIPYKEYYHDKGIAYTHAPINGSGKAYNGAAASTHDNIAKAHDTSVVWFHSHKLKIDYFARMGADSKQMCIINAGCFFEDIPQYAKGSTDAINWWRGVLLLDHYEDDSFDIQTIRMSMLKGNYL